MSLSVLSLLSGLNCSGSEERLADCDHDGINVVPTGCGRAYIECKSKGSSIFDDIIHLHLVQ